MNQPAVPQIEQNLSEAQMRRRHLVLLLRNLGHAAYDRGNREAGRDISQVCQHLDHNTFQYDKQALDVLWKVQGLYAEEIPELAYAVPMLEIEVARIDAATLREQQHDEAAKQARPSPPPELVEYRLTAYELLQASKDAMSRAEQVNRQILFALRVLSCTDGDHADYAANVFLAIQSVVNALIDSQILDIRSNLAAMQDEFRHTTLGHEAERLTKQPQEQPNG